MQGYTYPVPTVYDHVRDPGYIYPILITGMVFFMASNVMPNLLPEAQRVMSVAPFLIQWGFMLLVFAIMAQWTRLLPGVTSLHVTWVNMTIAAILFFLIWNQIAADSAPTPKPESSSRSSSSRENPEKKEKREEKKSKETDPEPDPWDEMRAHPSAFLTTRLNRLVPWPFPMGRAAAIGNELWWESGVPSHVGHYNRPPGPDPEEEAKLKKEKERAAKEKERKEKEKQKAEAKAKAEKEAAEEAKRKEEEVKKRKEAEKRQKEREEAKKREAIEQRHKQKLWRTKCLAMIVGLSFLNRVLAFGLLLLFSLQILGQELNKPPETLAPVASASSSSTSSSGSRSSSGTTSSSSSSGSSARTAEEEERRRREKALKEREAAKASASSSSASSFKPSSSSSSKMTRTRRSRVRARRRARARWSRQKLSEKLAVPKQSRMVRRRPRRNRRSGSGCIISILSTKKAD